MRLADNEPQASETKSLKLAGRIYQARSAVVKRSFAKFEALVELSQ